MSADFYRDPYIDCDAQCGKRLFGSQAGLMDGATVRMLRRYAKSAGWAVALKSGRGKGARRLDYCPACKDRQRP
jgi:hypothetical protein